jgi:hypothetical protein
VTGQGDASSTQGGRPTPQDGRARPTVLPATGARAVDLHCDQPPNPIQPWVLQHLHPLPQSHNLPPDRSQLHRVTRPTLLQPVQFSRAGSCGACNWADHHHSCCNVRRTRKKPPTHQPATDLTSSRHHDSRSFVAARHDCRGRRRCRGSRCHDQATRYLESRSLRNPAATVVRKGSARNNKAAPRQLQCEESTEHQTGRRCIEASP